MKANIEIVEERLFAATVADEIIACIEEALSEHEFCSIVLSGGMTPGSVYRMMSRPPRVRDIPWDKIKFFWGDERWVPKESDQSNYKMVEGTMLSQLSELRPAVFAIDTSLSSPEEAARSYSEVIAKEVPQENGLPKFNIVLLGMGTDGHVASVFPDDEKLALYKKGEGLTESCYAVTHDNRGGQSTARVTLSVPALFAAERVLFIVAGDRKADIVHQVLGLDNSSNLPVDAYKSASGSVSWFLDSPAARKLDKD